MIPEVFSLRLLTISRCCWCHFSANQFWVLIVRSILIWIQQSTSTSSTMGWPNVNNAILLHAFWSSPDSVVNKWFCRYTAWKRFLVQIWNLERYVSLVVVYGVCLHQGAIKEYAQCSLGLGHLRHFPEVKCNTIMLKLREKTYIVNNILRSLTFSVA